jgi:hypothetical protein
MKKVISFLILLFAGTANAGLIIGATDIPSNTMGTAAGSTDNIINQSGLSVGYTSGVTDFDSYLATHPVNVSVNAWAGVRGVLGEIVFDLGGIYTIDSFVLWTQSNSNAVNAFSILVDGNLAGSFNALVGSAPSITAQAFDLKDLTGQFITLQVSSNHGGLNVNIGEVAFETTSVPEPAILALLGLGLAGIGFSRKKTA